MRALLVVHVGETLGHLVRALAVARELKRIGVDVHVACSRRGSALVSGPQYRVWPVTWEFSHNSMSLARPSSSLVEAVRVSTVELLHVMKAVRPDIVIGFPGVFSAQPALALGLRHLMVLHGPYLSPIVHLSAPTEVETRVLDASREFFANCVDGIYEELASSLELPDLVYDDLLVSAAIVVPQPDLPLLPRTGLWQVRYVRASIGADLRLDESHLERCCHITFGSGNPCDITDLVHEAAKVFEGVIVSSGPLRLEGLPPNVVQASFVASASLAGRVRAVISHGGIGTIGTFAEHGTPQLIIPTEVDQATMAVHAVRAGLAHRLGLESWAETPRLGRHLPNLAVSETRDALVGLANLETTGKRPTAGGALDIALVIAEIAGSPLTNRAATQLVSA